MTGSAHRGTVFDIREFTLHDGPGPRVTVFLKGCPLRCVWCHNPEGLRPQRELMLRANGCLKCGRCHEPCPHEECRPFDRCLHACPLGLVSASGEEWEAEKLAERLLRNADYYAARGGGVTFSGGEPLLQAEFVGAVCGKLPKLHKALQTSGHARGETFRQLAEKMDYVLFDLKLWDPEKHKIYTGVTNEWVHGNFRWLQKSGIPHVVRIPMIPGITDTRENLEGLHRLAEGSRVERIPYNVLAGAKYPMLGLSYPLERGIAD